MIQPRSASRHIAIGFVLSSCLASGCVTVSPQGTGFSWKSLSKPKIQQANFEEKLDEVPKSPKNPAKLKLAYGRMMEESGDYVEARKNYEAVIDLQPKNEEAILGIARLHLLNGEVEQAEQGFRRVVKQNPSSAAAQFGLGEFFASQKRWKEASESLTKAMLAEPDQSQYRYALAVALVHCGDVDSALPHFIRTVGDAEAHYNVGMILQQDGKLADAERQFSLAVAKKPDFTAAQEWLAQVQSGNPGSNPFPSSEALAQSKTSASGPVASVSSAVPGSNATVVPAGHSNSAVESVPNMTRRVANAPFAFPESEK
ncbi:tetratricopeptide repeat protein [Planctomicrobium sp. SH527]|uniref:tetratricopeptide repeat protein n=1 Tax=Planctomicrobium sp. SH527 TaxID=3448123 RepID=UPI003F5C5A26